MLSAKFIAILALALTSQMTKHKVLTCWMPGSDTIKAGLEAGFRQDVSALFNLASQHVVDSASRCFFGPPPKEQIFQAAKDGDLKQAVAVAETAPTVLEVTNEQGETPLHLAAAKG